MIVKTTTLFRVLMVALLLLPGCGAADDEASGNRTVEWESEESDEYEDPDLAKMANDFYNAAEEEEQALNLNDTATSPPADPELQKYNQEVAGQLRRNAYLFNRLPHHNNTLGLEHWMVIVPGAVAAVIVVTGLAVLSFVLAVQHVRRRCYGPYDDGTAKQRLTPSPQPSATSSVSDGVANGVFVVPTVVKQDVNHV